MLFFRRFKPAACWMFLIGAMSFAQWLIAAQLAAVDPEVPVVDGAVIGLDARELKWIAEHPRVVVASTQYPAYLFRDEYGQWSGLNNDVLNRISAMTGLQFVHEESFSTDHLLGRLESGAADMTTTLVINDERKVFLDFSHAFGGAGWVFIGRVGGPVVQSLEQLSKRVLVLPVRHALESMIRRDYPDIELRSVKTYAEARAMVETGEAYATIGNEIGAQLYPPGLLQVGHAVEGSWRTDHLAVRKDQPLLLSILNKALEAFAPDELRAIHLKWLNGIVPVRASTTWQRLTQWGCWGVFAASVFGLLSLLWNRRLTVLIQQRLNAEESLRDQLALQHALINAMPDPVFVRDLEGRLIMCNKSYEERLSTRFDQVRGRRLIELDVLPRETAELLHAEFMSQLGTRKSLFSERQLMFKNGLRTIYQWTVPFYSADGQLRGVLGGWTDIGKRTTQS